MNFLTDKSSDMGTHQCPLDWCMLVCKHHLSQSDSHCLRSHHIRIAHNYHWQRHRTTWRNGPCKDPDPLAKCRSLNKTKDKALRKLKTAQVLNVPDIQKVLTMMASTWFHHCSHIGFTELQLKDSATPTPCNLNAHACKHFAIYIIINHHHKLQTSKRHLKVKCRAQGFSRGPKIVPFKKLTKKWSS